MNDQGSCRLSDLTMSYSQSKLISQSSTWENNFERQLDKNKHHSTGLVALQLETCLEFPLVRLKSIRPKNQENANLGHHEQRKTQSLAFVLLKVHRSMFPTKSQ